MAQELTKLKIEAYRTSSFQQSDLISGAVFVGDFNPTDYTLKRTNSYSSQHTQGTSKPETSYAHGNNDELTIAFTFDGTGVAGPTGSVADRVNAFMGLLEYRGDIHKPAYAKVIWGDFTFQGVIASATAKYTLFDVEGVPLRAKIDASLTEVVNEAERIAEEKTSSPDVDRMWVVRQGDRLDRIAFECYGDERYWWQLAAANRLRNTRFLTTGSILRLPRLVR